MELFLIIWGILGAIIFKDYMILGLNDDFKYMTLAIRCVLCGPFIWWCVLCFVCFFYLCM